MTAALVAVETTQTLLLVGSHLLVAAFSSGLTWLIFQRAAGAPVVPHHHHHAHGPPPPSPKRSLMKRRPSLVALAILLAGVVAVVYGFTQQAASRAERAEARKQRVCFARVVDQLTESSTARGAANARLQTAITQKSAAQDEINDVFVLALQQQPDSGDNTQASAKIRERFKLALQHYLAAKAAQTEAQKNYDKVRLANPAPPSVKKSCLPPPKKKPSEQR